MSDEVMSEGMSRPTIRSWASLAFSREAQELQVQWCQYADSIEAELKASKATNDVLRDDLFGAAACINLKSTENRCNSAEAEIARLKGLLSSRETTLTEDLDRLRMRLQNSEARCKAKDGEIKRLQGLLVDQTADSDDDDPNDLTDHAMILEEVADLFGARHEDPENLPAFIRGWIAAMRGEE